MAMAVKRTKSGHVRQWLVCKKCKTILHYDYTPYGLVAYTVVASCKCGSTCLNDESGRKKFRCITATQAKEQKRVNRAKSLKKADLNAYPYAAAGRD